MFQQGESGKGLRARGSGDGDNLGSVLGPFYEKSGAVSLVNERVRKEAFSVHKSA